MPAYCDVSLPVPLDQPFTYSLPETLQQRARRGCRIVAPLGGRKLVGVILRVHDDPPGREVRETLRLVDEEPVFDEDLLWLAEWIARYYCAPLGEVLRAMTPLSSEVRTAKVYALTDTGRAVARQLLLAQDNDPAAVILKLLEKRPFSSSYLAKKVPAAQKTLQSLKRKGWIEIEETAAGRDPLRAPSTKLIVERTAGAQPVAKLSKPERELFAYLELHPGAHLLADVEKAVKKAARAARSLARRGLLTLRPDTLVEIRAQPVQEHVLNEHQQRAFEAVCQSLESGGYQAYLLQGVTGSGKTEVYMRCIGAALSQGRGALMLVPEIALTPAVSGQFLSRFGDQVAILHSAFSSAERAEQWRQIQDGKARVVVATRSGVFAPVQNLGLIIVDEEHDGSYKQEETPRYHGRDVAVMRARHSRAVVLLGSATPSLESRYNVQRGKYTLLELPERIAGRPMPEVEIVDMRQEFLETRTLAVFSRRLVDAIQLRLEANEQVILLLNRRGFASFVACRSCGSRLECVNCAVTLTYHHRERRMLCHYCGYTERPPAHCPKCESEYVQFLGAGSERVENDLHLLFPRARIVRMDRDTVSGKRSYERILQGFRAHEYDVLVGTQMIAKGHDIPKVTLVGVVSADIGLGMPDFRAAERTFQLLTQVAGRAGRGHLPGQVVIQTMNPDHYAIRFAAAQNYMQFFEKELQFRRMMRYPPFTALAKILVRSKSQAEAMEMATEIGKFFGPQPKEVKLLGPAEAPIPKLKQEFRYQLLLKAASRTRLNELLQSLRAFALAKGWPSTSLILDVDPLTLL
ncbi:MAG: primosomal protein N' [Bryobacteraceae bacterium]|nr:primosomal protein N' [Bryobacteraceae bacterium]MDW8380211.1 primosomal protein N' [Bryobacterales bacterium]